ncbi:MAG TPA: hypothetical protein VIV60_05860 [Polyangiaceae bacterium]
MMRIAKTVVTGWLVSFPLVIGCGKKSSGASATARSTDATTQTTRAPAVVAVPPAKPTTAPSVASASESESDFSDVCDPFPVTKEAIAISKREFAAARQLMAKRSYHEAIPHYTKALSTGVDDAACLGERGYARLLTNDLQLAKDDLWQAAGACGSDTVRAQVWYNLGVLFEQQNDPEMSRVALARSVALGGSKQAMQKLGQRSTCQSSIKRADQLPLNPMIANVEGWLGVHKQLLLDGSPTTEAAAKRTVCNTVSRAAGGPPDTEIGVCGDAPPWWISCCSGYGAFTARTMALIPLEKGRFFTIDVGWCGGWPRGCQGHREPKIEVRGRLAIVTDEDNSMGPNLDFDEHYMPKGDADIDPPCRRGPRVTTLSIHDMHAAKTLLEVQSLTHNPVVVEVNEALTQAKLTGPGCSAVIALAKGSDTQ